MCIILALTALQLMAGDQGYLIRTEAFDRDPGWEGYGNRAVPAKFPTVTRTSSSSEEYVLLSEAGRVSW